MADQFESYLGPDGFPATTCDPLTLPEGLFSDCPEAYVALEGEIDEIYLSAVQFNDETGKYEAVTPPADWEAIASYIDVAGLTRLIGFGDKPLAEPLSIPLPRNRSKVYSRKHTLNFDITDMPIENYELIRSIQGTGLVAMNYKIIDGEVFGGADMIICDVVNAGNLHTRGEGALLTGQIILSWKNLFDPPRATLDAAAPLTMGKVKQPAALKSSKPKQPSKQLEEAV